MRLDSPLVLATAGTLAIHVIVMVCADAIVVTHPVHPEEVAPHVELVDIVPVPPPPPPPVPPPAPEVQPPEPPHSAPASPPPHAPRVRAASQPPPSAEPPPEAARPDPAPSGGAPSLAMPDLAPAATGIPVAKGTLTTGRIGRGGTGTGTGSGTGGGSGDTPVPVSVATIKTRAMPRGDYDYFNTKDYPAEARQLGIEGTIRVRLVVDAQGHVKSSVLLNRLGHGLDELALQRAAMIQFEPARDTDDHPVASVVVWSFVMTLPK